VQAQTHYSISRSEALRNRGSEKYIDLLKSRRTDSAADMADLLEESGWGLQSSSSDALNPRGALYWLSMHADGTITDGYNGYTVRYADGSSSTTKGGIDGSTYSRWANWVAGYSSVNQEFITKMRKAFYASSFKSPITVEDMQSGDMNNFRIYCGLDQITAYEDLVTQAQDLNVPDLLAFHGATAFKRIPLIYIHQLDDFTVIDGGDNDASPDPFIGINHNHFYPYVQSGEWLREDGPIRDREQHNVFTTFVDSSYNYFCNNVRAAGFVVHKTIPAS
jgi:hypothetical protein